MSSSDSDSRRVLCKAHSVLLRQRPQVVAFAVAQHPLADLSCTVRRRQARHKVSSSWQAFSSGPLFEGSLVPLVHNAALHHTHIKGMQASHTL